MTDSRRGPDYLSTVGLAAAVFVAVAYWCSFGVSSVGCAAHERVWIRAKADPKLGTLFDWTEFGARKGEALDVALAEALGIEQTNVEGERHFYAYKVLPIQLDKTVDELHFGHGEEIYVSSEELMAR